MALNCCSGSNNDDQVEPVPSRVGSVTKEAPASRNQRPPRDCKLQECDEKPGTSRHTESSAGATNCPTASGMCAQPSCLRRRISSMVKTNCHGVYGKNQAGSTNNNPKLRRESSHKVQRVPGGACSNCSRYAQPQTQELWTQKKQILALPQVGVNGVRLPLSQASGGTSVFPVR